MSASAAVGLLVELDGEIPGRRDERAGAGGIEHRCQHEGTVGAGYHEHRGGVAIGRAQPRHDDGFVSARGSAAGRAKHGRRGEADWGGEADKHGSAPQEGGRPRHWLTLSNIDPLPASCCDFLEIK